MSRRCRPLLAILLVGALTAGCGTTSREPAPPIVTRPIPPESPFAKLKIGMGSDEVFATIGPPTSQGDYQTGKAFIPFHFGGDNYRMIARYKGQGTIIFSQDSAFASSMSTIEINYDPDEPGFERH